MCTWRGMALCRMMALNKPRGISSRPGSREVGCVCFAPHETIPPGLGPVSEDGVSQTGLSGWRERGRGVRQSCPPAHLPTCLPPALSAEGLSSTWTGGWRGSEGN